MRLELVSDSVVHVPDLKPAVPAHTREIRLNANTLASVDRAESHLRNPVNVVVLFSRHFAFTKGIEELDSSFGTSREDLPVIRRESNCEDLLLVTDESL